MRALVIAAIVGMSWAGIDFILISHYLFQLNRLARRIEVLEAKTGRLETPKSDTERPEAYSFLYKRFTERR